MVLDEKPSKMRAIQFQGNMQVRVGQVDFPKMIHPQTKQPFHHGAVLKVIASNICGSDLHMYRGHASLPAGFVFGHEITGEVVEVGSDVQLVRVGDLVSVPFNVACGKCENCKRQLTNLCTICNLDTPFGAAYGYAMMGGWLGGQSEYHMVPFADFNLLRIPDKQLGMSKIFDISLLSDVLPTGYQAVVQADVRLGSIVYIAGAGPVGICAAACAKLLGAARVLVGDVNPSRLDAPKRMGCDVVDLSRTSTQQLQQQLQSLVGVPFVDVGVDCVGFECHGHGTSECAQEQPSAVLDSISNIVRPGGVVSIPGVYMSMDAKPKDPMASKGRVPFSFGLLWQKGVKIVMGQTTVGKYNRELLTAILNNKLTVAPYLNMRVITLDQAVEGYRKFSDGEPVKLVIDPHNLLSRSSAMSH